MSYRLGGIKNIPLRRVALVVMFVPITVALMALEVCQAAVNLFDSIVELIPDLLSDVRDCWSYRA